VDTLSTTGMIQRFKQRADAVRKRTIPPIAGAERKEFIQQAEFDYQDFAMIADSVVSLDGGFLTIDLRPVICDADIRSPGPLEQGTRVAMENIATALPADGAKISPSMLDSKSDLQDLMNGSEMFRTVETIEPINASACPGFSLTHGYLT